MGHHMFSRIKTKIASFYLKSGKGTILLEAAIAIFLIAMASGFAMRKATTYQKNLNVMRTKTNMETVAMSLAAFVANYKRLPKPANDFLGKEGREGTLSGFVPYLDLGISENIAKDGNGVPLVYIAEPQLTQEHRSIYEYDIAPQQNQEAEDFYHQGVNRYFCEHLENSAIIVKDSPTTDVAFVLDVQENSHNISDRAEIISSNLTLWLSRDMLLMKYIKSSPCCMENPMSGDRGNDHW